MMQKGDLEARISGLFIGRVKPLWPGKAPSAIAKTPADGPLMLQKTGFAEDAQADLTVHGGPEKALHHYAADHYPDWNRELELHSGHFGPGSFGENISAAGLTERSLCIGDTLRLGGAIVQVSQGRQPCWKLNAHTGRDDMAYLFQNTGRTGWYYRVLEPGPVGLGDRIVLVDRINPDWSVEAVTRARLSRRVDTDQAGRLAVLAGLAPGWRAAFSRMAAGDTKDDSSARLGG